MASLDPLRIELVTLLRGGNAHADSATILRDVPATKINERLSGAPHTLWELMEHLRLAQRDILDFVRDPDYEWPTWPDDYWPAKDREATADDWEGSVGQFLDDLETVIRLVESNETDLTRPLPHAPKYSVLREALLVADHNSHHLGQMILLRRQLGCWG